MNTLFIPKGIRQKSFVDDDEKSSESQESGRLHDASPGLGRKKKMKARKTTVNHTMTDGASSGS